MANDPIRAPAPPPLASPSVPELFQLLDLARTAALEAAEHVAANWERNREADTKASLTDLVTEMDRASESMIVERILAARPDDGLLGEEGASRESTSGVRWVIDPIDGTTNYVYGHPGWSISIAAERDGLPVVGVVIDPLHGDIFTAIAGRGARHNDELMEVGEPASVEVALVATGFSAHAELRHEEARALTHVLPRVRDIRRGGSAAVDLCWVGLGRVDAFYHRGLGPWDYAAGALIAAEAGAIVSDLGSGSASGEMVFAAAPTIAADLRSVIAAGFSA